jgi:hypothetical protein
MADDGMGGSGEFEGVDVGSSGKMYVGRAWFRVDREPEAAGTQPPFAQVTSPFGVEILRAPREEAGHEQTVVVARPLGRPKHRAAQIAVSKWVLGGLIAFAFATGLLAGALTRSGSPGRPRSAAPVARSAPVIAPLPVRVPPATAMASPAAAPTTVAEARPRRAAPTPQRKPPTPAKHTRRAPAPSGAPAAWVDPFAE